MAEERKRLVITADDLPPAAPRPATAAMPPVNGGAMPGGFPPAMAPPGRKIAVQSPGAWQLQTAIGGTLPSNAVAGLVATLVGWLAFELFFGSSNPTDHLVRHAALEFGVYAAIFGAIFAAWDDITSRVWQAAARTGAIGLGIGAVGGAISGAVAQQIYGNVITAVIRQAIQSGTAPSPTAFKLDAARALGWAIIGVGVGVAAGVARRSGQKVINGLIGGAVGGAVGGFLFNFIGQATNSEFVTRMVTFTVAGVLIGAAIGLVEVARRQAWVKIVGGGMTGKEFVVYHANTNFGSSPKCQITLIKDPGVAPFHFRIDEQGPKRFVTAYDGALTSINGTPVSQQWLRNGDLIEAGGTTLQYLERAVAG